MHRLLKVPPQVNFFARHILESFHGKSKLPIIHFDMLALVSTTTWEFICTNWLFSFGEIIGQTIKLFWTASRQNSARKGRSGLSLFIKASNYSHLHKLPDLAIKVDSFDDFNNSVDLLNRLRILIKLFTVSHVPDLNKTTK